MMIPFCWLDDDFPSSSSFSPELFHSEIHLCNLSASIRFQETFGLTLWLLIMGVKEQK